MSKPWRIVYFRDKKGNKPVEEFFKLPSKIGITDAEKAKLNVRLRFLSQRGPKLARERSDLFEVLEDADNLYSIRIPKTTNNPRVLVCIHPTEPNCFVLLHAFKEKSSKDYKKAIKVAEANKKLL